MDEKEKLIQKLKDYFEKRDDVVMAFLFGSQAKGYARRVSDWDIGVYFEPQDRHAIELEIDRDYPESHRIRGDIERIVSAEVDLVVLNRAASPLVFSVLNKGAVLTLKSRALYLRLLLKTYYEAIDFWKFTQDFLRIRERSHSLSDEDRSDLIKHIIFLENEYSDLEYFKSISRQQYEHDRTIKRNIERWVENLVMASLDIAKIMLSSEKKNVPDSYRDTLRAIGFMYFDEPFAMVFADFADLRNLVAHEYLDYRWKHIQRFIKEAPAIYPRFLSRMKELAK